jgi:hypothetical protein
VTSEIRRQLIRFLLPHWCRIIGFLLFFSGIISTYLLYVLDFKPDILNIKVFAVFSYYFDKKYLSVISNDAGEEISIILILIGLLLLSLSKLRNESDESLSLRIQALFITVYINTFIILLSVIFIYGVGFIAFTIVNCFSLLFINYTVFRILLIKQKNQK